MRGNTSDPNSRDYPAWAEFAAYDRFPEPVKKVVQQAPFQVCCLDMVNNSAVMEVYREKGPEAFAEWLEGMLMRTYRTKIAPASHPR